MQIGQKLCFAEIKLSDSFQTFETCANQDTIKVEWRKKLKFNRKKNSFGIQNCRRLSFV